MSVRSLSLLHGVGLGVVCLLPWWALGAQSLRGSRASIDRMANYAARYHLYHYQTRTGIHRAVKRKRLVPLRGSDTYALHRVRNPYVKPATRLFVERLSAQYSGACGEPIIVTSAVRPARAQPWNSTVRSVHPTGMAIDLRKPAVRACRLWLRRTLRSLERVGVIEATEEFAPPHFHVAVYDVPYRTYVKRRVTSKIAVLPFARTTSRPSSYQVRQGDTLWRISLRYHVAVDRIIEENHLTSSTLQPGQRLIFPPSPTQ